MTTATGAPWVGLDAARDVDDGSTAGGVEFLRDVIPEGEERAVIGEEFRGLRLEIPGVGFEVGFFTDLLAAGAGEREGRMMPIAGGVIETECDAAFFAGAVEGHGAVHGAVVGEGDGGLLQLFGAFDEAIDAAEAIEK